MDPSMEDLVLIARKIGETAGIPNHVERARQVRAVVLELEAARRREEAAPFEYSAKVKRYCWATLSLFLISFGLGAGAVAMPNLPLGALSSFAMFAATVCGLLWLENGARERRDAARDIRT